MLAYGTSIRRSSANSLTTSPLTGQDRGDDLGPEVLELIDRREVVPDGHIGAEHGAQGAGRADGADDEQDPEPSRPPQLADPDLEAGSLSLSFGILILRSGIFMAIPGRI